MIAIGEMMNRKKDIIKIIKSIAGKYSEYEVFSDWIRCSALAINNSCSMIHDKIWHEREKTYIETMNKYSLEEQQKLCEMFFMLWETFEDYTSDVLGEIYMEAGMGSKAAGQFFTPFHLSELCARLGDIEPDERGIYKLNEPSCGGGGMIIAFAKVLKDKGINYQQCMDVVAQDLDWKGVYMTYLQCSIMGIRATVVQGNTLQQPYADGYPRERVLYTPAKMGLLI